MDTPDSCEWVVPVLRDVAAVLKASGLQESSTFILAAAVIVQREMTKKSGESLAAYQVPNVAQPGNIVAIHATARACR